MFKKMGLTLGVLALSATLLSTTSKASTQDPRYFVTSPDEFNSYVKTHRQRTRLLALELFQSYPESYADVTIDQVDAFLQLHDLSKSIPEISHRLYKQYSRPIHTANKRQKEEFQAWVNYLNNRDLQNAQKFFVQNNLSEEQIVQLLEIEKIADLVDRSFDPVAQEDFAKVMVPASEFLKNEAMAQKAKLLEANYLKITHGRAFLDEHRAKSHSCKVIL